MVVVFGYEDEMGALEDTGAPLVEVVEADWLFKERSRFPLAEDGFAWFVEDSSVFVEELDPERELTPLVDTMRLELVSVMRFWTMDVVPEGVTIGCPQPLMVRSSIE